MEELQDYSGPLSRDLQPRVSLDAFSKDAIVRMTAEATKLYLGSEGGCYTVARKRFGEELANHMDRELWLERAAPQVVARLRKLFRIDGDDVASFLKFLQIEPLFAINLVEYELREPKLGVVTVRRCRSLEYFERHGEEGLQKNACGMHASGLQRTARDFNPQMRVKAVTLPPRQITMGNPGRKQPPIACRWEVTIED